jgi:hypothetical protein
MLNEEIGWTKALAFSRRQTEQRESIRQKCLERNLSERLAGHFRLRIDADLFVRLETRK